MKNKLVENFSALTIMQLLNYALPFITLPYLVRVLGMESYGAYLFSQALITYFMIFVDFGFDLYATRQVSINRDNKQKLEEIISAVFTWKILFALISLVIILILTTFVPLFKEYQTLHLLNFAIIFGSLMFANFYYQGIEQMKYITILNAVAKISFTVLIFVLVKNENDLALTALINSGGYILLGVVSMFIINKNHKIRFVQVPKEYLLTTLKESAQFFWSRVAVSTYTVSNTFIIGLVLGNTAAGLFGSADKIFRGIMSLYAPLNTVFYPYIAYQKNVILYKKVMKFAFSLNILISILVFMFAEYIISILFGPGYEESVLILKLLCVALIYVLPHVMIGYPLLGGMGYSREVNMSVIYASILHVILLICMIPNLSLILVTCLVLFTEFVVFSIRCYYVGKYKLLRS